MLFGPIPSFKWSLHLLSKCLIRFVFWTFRMISCKLSKIARIKIFLKINGLQINNIQILSKITAKIKFMFEFPHKKWLLIKGPYHLSTYVKKRSDPWVSSGQIRVTRDVQTSESEKTIIKQWSMHPIPRSVTALSHILRNLI